MKCPYREFQECIVEKCPACNYTEEKKKIIEGRIPYHMSTSTAIERGIAWESIKTIYKFISCKLVENGVQPVIPQKQVINNTQKTNVVINKSIF